MMTFAPVFLLALVATFIAPSEAAPTLLAREIGTARAKEAQHLNAYYESLSFDLSCNDGEQACVNGRPALCQAGKWSASHTACPDLQRCYAIPTATSSGTMITCIADKTALSIFAAYGLKGTCTDDAPASAPSTPTTPIAAVSPSAPSDDEGITTKILTLYMSQTLTMEPATTTMLPDEASAFMAGLSAGGAQVVFKDATPTSAAVL